MCQQAQSPFFALSQEIRDAVYHYALAFDDDDFTILGPADILSRTGYRNDAKLPEFLRTCKMMYREAAPIALSQASLRFRFDDYRHVTSAATYFAPGWSRVRHLSVLVQTSAPCYRDWVRRVEDLLSQMPALQTVALQWHCDPPKPEGDAETPPALRMIQAREESRLVGLLTENQPSLRTVYFQGEWAPAWLEEVGKGTGMRVVHNRAPFKIEATRRRWKDFFDHESGGEDTGSDGPWYSFAGTRALGHVLFPPQERAGRVIE